MSSFKFRILIDTETSDDIFRDIVISSTSDFELFYRSIITAFEFEGDQLASFYVSNDNWDKGHEIALMDMGMSGDLDAPFIMKDTLIQNVANTTGQKLILVYDFLKMWCFLIELVEVLPTETEQPYIDLSVGIAPHENDKEIDMENALMGMDGGPDLGNDIDDIFSDMEDEDDFGSFENIDDLDI